MMYLLADPVICVPASRRSGGSRHLQSKLRLRPARAHRTNTLLPGLFQGLGQGARPRTPIPRSAAWGTGAGKTSATVVSPAAAPDRMVAEPRCCRWNASANNPPITGAVIVAAPDAGPIAETTRVISYAPLELHGRGIHAV